MANESDKLGIVLETESGGSGFQEFRDELKKTEQAGTESAEKIEQSYTESLTKIRNVSAVAFAAVGAAIGLSVREAAAAEQGMIGYRAAVRNAGGDADAFAEQIDEAAMRLQRLTGIADDEFIEVATRMTDMTGDASGAIANLGLVADLAAAKKIDLASAGDMVARAMEGEAARINMILPGLNDQIAALGENADKAEVMAVIFDRLAVFEGRAGEMADSTTGSFNKLTQEIGTTTENIGGAFLDSVRGVTDNLTSVVKGVGDWAKEHQVLVGVIGGGALTVAGFLTVATSIALIAPRVVEGLAMIRTAAIALSASPWGVVAMGILAVAGVAYQLSDAMTATMESETDLNEITKRTGVSYDELRYKQEAIFGKFADYKSGTDEQRAAWNLYVASLKTSIPTLDEVVITAGKLNESIATPKVATLTTTTQREFGPIKTSDDNNVIYEQYLDLKAKKEAADKVEKENREMLWEEERQEFLFHTAFLQGTFASMTDSFTNMEMTGKQRREQIWNTLRSSFIRQVGAQVQAHLFGELAKQHATSVTAGVQQATFAQSLAASIAHGAKEIGLALQTAAARIYAFYASLGPFGIPAAAATVAGVYAAVKALHFQEGGIVPGSGRGDKVPAMLEPGEGVVKSSAVQSNPGVVEALNSGAGIRGYGGSTYHIHLDRDTALDQVIRIRELFESWAVPVIEQKMREGAFAMKGVPL